MNSAKKTLRVLPPVLMLGAVSQIAQVLLLRELLMVFQGNELSIGVILASWMLWVGAGSFLGAFVSERSRGPLTLVKISVAGIFVLLPGTIVLIRYLRGFHGILPGAYLSPGEMVLSSLLVMAPVCLLLGAQFVLLARVWRERDGVSDTSGAGKTYVGEAAGNMLGGILFTFLMVHWFNPFQSAVLVAALMAGAVVVAGAVKAKGREKVFRGGGKTLLAVLAVLVMVFPVMRKLNSRTNRAQWNHFAPEHNLVEVRHSKYGTIAVVERGGQYSFFQSGHLIFSTAGPGEFPVALEDQEAANFAHFAMTQHKNPRRILLIGGGLRGTLSEIMKYPVEKVHYLELDEVLTRTARAYLPAATLLTLSDPRVNTIHQDGRFFLQGVREGYDMIIVDMPDPATAVLNRYYTREFFLQAREQLNTGGVFVCGTVSTPDLRGQGVANRNAAIYHTLNSIFDRVLVAGERFMFYFASDDSQQITVDVPTLIQRFDGFGIESEDFSAPHFHTLIQQSQLRRVNWIVRNHGRKPGAHIEGPSPGPISPPSVKEQQQAEKELPGVEERYFINSDFRPLGYFYSLMFWEQLTRSGREERLKKMLEFDRRLMLVPFLIALLAALGLRLTKTAAQKRPDISFGVLVAVFTTGFSTMALQIALIFSFQSVYGFVYEMVGLIVAIFMLGLALGTHSTNCFVEDKRNFRLLAGVQFMIALFALVIAFSLPRAAAVAAPAAVFALFSLATFAAGFINGVDFPLAAACFAVSGSQAEKAAGTVYGTELLGACSGAVISGVLVVPVMGMGASCIMAAVAAGTAFLVLLVTRTRSFDTYRMGK